MLTPTILTDARNYVEFWFKSKKLSVKQLSKAHVRECILDYTRDIQGFNSQNNSRHRAICDKHLTFAFEAYLERAEEQARLDIIFPLAFNGKPAEGLKTWIKAVSGTVLPVDIAIMSHWMWQVKRKMFGKKVVYHIMPVLKGPQGSGKSTAILNLLAPVDDLVLKQGLKVLSDERHFESLSTHFIMFCDEMQGVERTDLNVLKNQISTDTNNFRRLFTSRVISVPQNVSFIGTSNKPLAEVLNDSTGMRRFWEIQSIADVDRIVNDLDYLEMWKNIDENLPTGYLTGQVLKDVLEAQQEMIVKEPVDVFIEESNLVPLEAVKLISHIALFDHYRIWAMKSNTKHVLDSSWFAKKLRSRLPYTREKDSRGVSKTVYKVNPNAVVFEMEAEDEQATTVTFRQ